MCSEVDAIMGNIHMRLPPPLDRITDIQTRRITLPSLAGGKNETQLNTVHVHLSSISVPI